MFLFSVIVFNKNCNFFFSFLIWGSKILSNLIEIISFSLLNLFNRCLNFNHLPFNWFWIIWNIYSMLQCHILVRMHSFFIYKWLLCKVTGLVFIIIDAYYIIDTFLNRQRAVFIDGTLRQRRNGQLTMSRKKQCQKLHFSLAWRCKMVKTQKQNRDQKLNNELHQINKILTRKRWILVRVPTTMKMTCNLEGKKLRIWNLIVVLVFKRSFLS